MPIPRSKEAERVAHEAIEKHGLKEAAHQLGVTVRTDIKPTKISPTYRLAQSAPPP